MIVCGSVVIAAADGMTATAVITVRPGDVGCVICVAHDDEW